jgi:hypothetical protein
LHSDFLLYLVAGLFARRAATPDITHYLPLMLSGFICIAVTLTAVLCRSGRDRVAAVAPPDYGL